VLNVQKNTVSTHIFINKLGEKKKITLNINFKTNKRWKNIHKFLSNHNYAKIYDNHSAAVQRMYVSEKHVDYEMLLVFMKKRIPDVMRNHKSCHNHPCV
jgi:hypothetical protein